MISSYYYQDHTLGFQTSAGWAALNPHLSAETPTYVYNSTSIQGRIQKMKKAFAGAEPQIHYAVKSNAFSGILKLMHQNDFGVDVVSGGEAQMAMDNGFSPQKIIFSGVAKSKKELEMAIQKNFFQINVESLEELHRIGSIAKNLQKKVCVGLRINPNIRVETHPYITTGFRENKFGISEDQIREAVQVIKANAPWIQLQGLSSHIGSQIRDLSPLLESLECLLKSTQALLEQGFPLKTIDMGGGVGIDYFSDDETNEVQLLETLGQRASALLKNSSVRLLLEPGRWLVARSGVLCAQVEYVKFNGHKNFVILNTGMHHLLRPALYKAHHRILPLTLHAERPQKMYDVVGPICESSDVIGQDRLLSAPQEGEWMGIMDAGAYGMAMSSSYNHHAFPREILV